MAKKTVRLGLVGVGAAAQVNHIPAIKKCEGLELVALCDRDPEKASRVAQKFGVAKSHDRLEDMLADEEIDAVDLCTPNYLHAPMAIAALEAGKHVLCERPLARSASEAEAMVKAAKKAGCTLMCALQHRFRPDSQLLRTFVQKGDLGEVYHVKTGWLRQRTEWESEQWRRQKRESGGGVVAGERSPRAGIAAEQFAQRIIDRLGERRRHPDRHGHPDAVAQQADVLDGHPPHLVGE